DIFSSYPHQLSGGQKQRVMIAMALSNNPRILIADEPTTALDVTVQKTILELMKNLQKKYGMSIIFITHDLGVIAEIANTVLVMYKGKIVERGKLEGIFKNPQHPYTKGLLACRPPLNIRLKKLPVIDDFLEKESKVTIKGFTKDLIISEKERKSVQKKIFEKEPILRLKNIKTFFPVKKGVFGKTKNYIKAVNDVSLNVYPGETLGLVGESGCGKTTLGRSILKLVDTNGGEILYNGKNIETISKNELRKLRKDLQIIFQDPYSSLNPRITVGSAIMEPMKVHKLNKNDKTRKSKVFELLEKVNLDKSYFYRYPHELSGGQRQRICIARALALNPKFIICDESVSALDVSIQAQVLNLLNDLKKEYGFTYIFISHDLSVVKFMSDRMAVMKDGKIEEIGDADEIYNFPKTEYTKNLIEAVPKGI
ncbi:MAG: ABC transporter ATP-binding protein, partial [Bacteroidetes bacterium]|nr:ABC transporter ATP-binding protein [Bacteroidota bacterium]